MAKAFTLKEIDIDWAWIQVCTVGGTVRLDACWRWQLRAALCASGGNAAAPGQSPAPTALSPHVRASNAQRPISSFAAAVGEFGPDASRF